MVHDTFVRSGDTADAFAARHGLQPLRVRRLHAALAARADDTAVHFAELTVATTGASDPGALRLDIGPSTIELRVLDPDRCPPEWLATLARALRGHAS